MSYGPLSNAQIVDLLPSLPHMQRRIDQLKDTIGELSRELSVLSRTVGQLNWIAEVFDGVALRRSGSETDGRMYAAGSDISRAAHVYRDEALEQWVLSLAENEWKWQGESIVKAPMTADEAWGLARRWVVHGVREAMPALQAKRTARTAVSAELQAGASASTSASAEPPVR